MRRWIFICAFLDNKKKDFIEKLYNVKNRFNKRLEIRKI